MCVCGNMCCSLSFTFSLLTLWLFWICTVSSLGWYLCRTQKLYSKMLKTVTKCQQKTPTNFPIWSFYGNILFFIAFGALRLQITQLLSIPNIRTLTFQSHIKLNSAQLTSAAQRRTFSSTWWSCSGKLIYSPLYPVIFLSLKKPYYWWCTKNSSANKNMGKSTLCVTTWTTPYLPTWR